MIEVKKLKDISLFRQSADGLSKEFWNYIEEYFRGIMQNLKEEDVTEEEFSLLEYGHIVILCRCDNIAEACRVGLNEKDGGLLAAPFEYVNKAPLEELWYEGLVVYDNEYAVTFIIQSGIGDELEEYLKEYLCE